MTVHFISKDWERVKFCLSCSQFDEKHSASNIFQKIENVAQEWDLSGKIKVCLRDNAAYVKAAFNEPGCDYKSAGCLNHSLQLVIKKELFSSLSIQNLIEKCQKLCNHASHSTAFYSELYKQQNVQMNNPNRLGLKMTLQLVRIPHFTCLREFYNSNQQLLQHCSTFHLVALNFLLRTGISVKNW